MRKCVFSFAMLALAGCATVPKATQPTGDITTCASRATSPTCESYIDVLNALSHAVATVSDKPETAMAFNGRVAISQGSNAGNARIEWDAQTLDRYSVELSAPVTAQTWRLEVEPGNARISGMKGGTREDSDPAALLKAATGWMIPVNEMRYWLRALPAPGSEATQVQFKDDGTGTLVGFTQAGWTLTFEGGNSKAPPTRMFAKNGENQVRLVVDVWTQPAKQ